MDENDDMMMKREKNFNSASRAKLHIGSLCFYPNWGKWIISTAEEDDEVAGQMLTAETKPILLTEFQLMLFRRS